MTKKVPMKALLAIFGALLYGASPIDLIPDLLPILGVVDDALVIPIMLVFAYLQMRGRRDRAMIPARVRRR